MSSTNLLPSGWRATSFLCVYCWLHLESSPGGSWQKPLQLSELKYKIEDDGKLLSMIVNTYMHSSTLTNWVTGIWASSGMLTVYIHSPEPTLMAALGMMNLADVGHSVSGSEVCLLPLCWSGVISVGGTLAFSDLSSLSSVSSACLLFLWCLLCCSRVLDVMCPDGSCCCSNVLWMFGLLFTSPNCLLLLSTSIGDSSCLNWN